MLFVGLPVRLGLVSGEELVVALHRRSLTDNVRRIRLIGLSADSRIYARYIAV